MRIIEAILKKGEWLLDAIRICYANSFYETNFLTTAFSFGKLAKRDRRAVAQIGRAHV